MKTAIAECKDCGRLTKVYKNGVCRECALKRRELFGEVTVLDCLDCGKPTQAEYGICRKCGQRRRAAWKKDVERFQNTVSSAWQRVREREGNE